MTTKHSLLVSSILLISTMLSAQDGTLDNDFDADGKVTTPIGNAAEFCYDIAVQTDSKILAVGSSFNGTNDDIALVRYNNDGSLDNSFGVGGKVVLNLGPSDRGQSIAVQPDGKILVGGRVNNSFHFEFLVVRFNSDGSLDNSFGTNGQTATMFTTVGAFVNKLNLLSDGKILLTGSAANGTDNDFAAARYNADGSKDSSFSDDGKLTLDLGKEDNCVSSMAQSDGKIVLLGFSNAGTNNDFVAVKYNANMTLDQSFGTNGKVITAIGNGDDFCRSAAMQPDGKIVAVGEADFGGKLRIALVRYHIDGTLDKTFNSLGKVTTSIGDGDAYCKDVAIQADGKIIVTGYAFKDMVTDIIVVRYNSNGSLDNTFGTNGLVTTDINTSSDFGQTIAIQPDSKILVGGQFYITPSDYDFAVLRYLSALNVGLIDFSILNRNLLIYPNPIQEDAVLEYTLANEEVLSLDLYDISGRLVQSILKSEERGKGSHKEKLEIDASIPSGSYILTLSNRAGSSSISIVK